MTTKSSKPRKKGKGAFLPVKALLLLAEPGAYLFATTGSDAIIWCGRKVQYLNETTFDVFREKDFISVPIELKPGLLSCTFTEIGRSVVVWMKENNIEEEDFTQLEFDRELLEITPQEKE